MIMRRKKSCFYSEYMHVHMSWQSIYSTSPLPCIACIPQTSQRPILPAINRNSTPYPRPLPMLSPFNNTLHKTAPSSTATAHPPSPSHPSCSAAAPAPHFPDRACAPGSFLARGALAQGGSSCFPGCCRARRGRRPRCRGRIGW